MPHILRAVKIAIDAGTSTSQGGTQSAQQQYTRDTLTTREQSTSTHCRTSRPIRSAGTPSGHRTQGDSIFTVEHATTPGVMPACVPHPYGPIHFSPSRQLPSSRSLVLAGRLTLGWVDALAERHLLYVSFPLRE